MKDPRPLLFNVAFAGALGVLTAGLFVTPQWQWPHLVIVLFVAMFLALLGNMDRVESIKAGFQGIEAKTREVIRQAEIATSELQNLAEVLATTLVEVIDGGGRMGGSPAAVKDRAKSDIREALKRMEVAQPRIQAAFEREHHYAQIDYILGASETFPPYVSPEENMRWSRERPRMTDWNNFISGAELRQTMASFSQLEPWREELLQDLEFYQSRRAHRRPRIWAQRDQWFAWTRNETWSDHS